MARPGRGLCPYVDRYVGYREVGVTPARHRGLPSPYVTLILTLDEPLVLASPGAPLRRFASLAGGLHTAPVSVVHDGAQAGIQLGLTPLGARALLGVPASALSATGVHANDVLGPSVDAVRDQVMSAGSWPERFAVLERWLAARVDREVALSPEVGEAWRLLVASGGTVPISTIACEVGWSTRYFRSRLLAEVGLTPKAASRVVRFDRARRRLQAGVVAGRPPALADLAADAGYADQAHLAREFRDLAGCPPSIWVAEEFPNVQAARSQAMPPSVS